MDFMGVYTVHVQLVKDSIIIIQKDKQYRI